MSENKFQHLRYTEFKRLGDQVYFDHTGSCLYVDSHIKRYSEQLTNNVFGNPHSGNACSEKMSDIIYQTRLDVLNRFNVTVDDYDVIFTSGATDSLKIIGDNFNWTPGSVYAYTEDNHTSVVGIRELAAERGASAYCVSCSKSTLSSSTIVKTPQNLLKSNSTKDPPSLFAFPAQSNFSGAKYPLAWIEDFKSNSLPPDLIQSSRKCNWYVLCDAASFVSTSALDLREYPADFVTISFYKMFGFPTGLGALLVRKNSEETLCNKKFFGGGSVSGWLASRDFHSPKPVLHDRFEDGSCSFLSILALKLGFDTFNRLGLTINTIETHTHDLSSNLYCSMKTLQHENGNPLVKIYLNQDDTTTNHTSQGPVLAFNIKRSDGSYVGYNHVVQLANSNNIYLRGGCFCNLGACVSLIGTEISVLLEAYEHGHVCGDAIDLIDGKPIGAVRISLGPHSTVSDINAFIEFLTGCFKEESCVYSPSQYTADIGKSTKIILDDILLYPIKSCQGMSVKEWEICDTGLKYDRMWMVVDEYGSPITLKKAPHLTSIRPIVDITKQCLTLRADGMDSIDVPFIQNLKEVIARDLTVNAKCVSKVCGDTVVGYDCGESVALWLSVILNVSCSLVQKCFNSQRYTSKRFNAYGNPNKISLVNEAQLLLVNRSSIKYLCGKMIEHGYLDESDTMLDNMAKRFRANLVVSGASSFSEDEWSRISFNAANTGEENGRVDMVKCGLCQRCNVICIDPDTGQKLNGPLRALANVSLSDNAVRRKPTFGIYLKCDQSSCVLTAKCEITIEDNT